MPTCPECRDSKHQNCDGFADIDDNDNLIPCGCDGSLPHPLR